MGAGAHALQGNDAGRRGWRGARAAAVVAIGRRTLVGAATVVGLVATWATAVTWYLVSSDEIAARVIARQAEMQYAYEDKLGAMRAHLDRVASQKLLEQDGLEGRLSDLIARQAQLETRQTVLLTLAVRAGTPPSARPAGTALAEAGLDPGRLRPAPPGAAAPMGGPLVPVGPDARPGPFEILAERASASLMEWERLRRAAAALPFGRPTTGDPDLTSGFGYRIDPFTRSPALHTGLDFRAEYGAPVRATGTGKVTAAEWSGGYGNMVELDHGNGVTTRYAHLSAIGVGVGQTVAAGALLGRVGSTGRSTGAHLHYEARIDDEPIDPQRFLRAGSRLGKTEGG